jgi:hypothetical protein
MHAGVNVKLRGAERFFLPNDKSSPPSPSNTHKNKCVEGIGETVA